jgi:dTDP-4-dehydrorhamnose reductase
VSKPKVLIVGASGMLGSALASVLHRNASVQVYATFRTPWPERLAVDGLEWVHFQAGGSLPPKIELGAKDWIVNAAGAIPQRPDDHGGDLGMVRANALLPYELAEICERTGARMINVTTDCVFSGRTSPGKASLNKYTERDTHDSHTFYARSKSMGEVLDNRKVLNLRCSIVGPQPRGKSSLLEWYLGSDQSVAGYADHFWNGVTTLALAKVIEGVILYEDRAWGDLPGVHHLVPKGHVSKAELLALFRQAFDAGPEIQPVNLGGVDRTLGTVRPELNNRLWALAGYEAPPTIEEMVQELARWVGAGNYLFKKEVQA